VAEELVGGSEPVMVYSFSPYESRALLELKVGLRDGVSDGEMMDRLVEVLGHVPLAITQAAAFMNRNGMSASTYRPR
jgi:hypothetical protein